MRIFLAGDMVGPCEQDPESLRGKPLQDGRDGGRDQLGGIPYIAFGHPSRCPAVPHSRVRPGVEYIDGERPFTVNVHARGGPVVATPPTPDARVWRWVVARVQAIARSHRIGQHEVRIRAIGLAVALRGQLLLDGFFDTPT